MTPWLTLRPHPIDAQSTKSAYTIQVHAYVTGTTLSIAFEIHDPLNEIIWPVPKTFEQRDYLWESTCFEAFISIPNQNAYFELNLSPSRAWNLYQFSDYRTPNTMPPPRVQEQALVTFEIVNKTIHAEIDLKLLHLTGRTLLIGLTAVIQTLNTFEYLSLTHPLDHADFHHAGGWTLALSPHEEFNDNHGQ